MIFFIEIKPFLLVKLGEMSEIMKYATNPNFMHFQGGNPLKFAYIMFALFDIFT